MKKAIIEAWLTDLRSGKYKQHHGSLMHIDEEGNKSFCCIGVLAYTNKVIDKEWKEYSFSHNLLDEFDTPLKCNVVSTLWEKNDGVNKEKRHTFPEIADYIEENILPLAKD